MTNTPTPKDENSIECLCQHLNPLQMEWIIHFLRKNAIDAGASDDSPYRRLERIIYKHFVAACHPRDDEPQDDKPQH